MNAFYFAMKRAHLRTVERGKALLSETGLTPARYDLLGYVHRNKRVRQAELRRQLGVARSTVSVMLKRLEHRGYVHRTRALGDRRGRYVELTLRGLSVVRRASKAPQRRAWREVICAVSPRVRDRIEGAATFESTLRRVGAVFGDRAQLGYAWHPDD